MRPMPIETFLTLLQLKDKPKNLIPTFVTGAAIDSRNVLPGNVFFALKGAKTDGHLYLKEVFQKGAAFAVVQKDFTGDEYPGKLIYVDDTLKALQDAARSFISQSKAQIVAITGSLGKTTTKGFIYTLLQSKYKVATTAQNQNSQAGLALSILNQIQGDEEWLVLEMGMTEKGQIEKLIHIAPPDIAVITTLALVHAINFEGIEEIAKSKAEIFLHPKTRLGIINADSPCVDILEKSGTCEKRLYSPKGNEEAYWSLQVHEKMLEIIEDGKKTFIEKINFPGPHLYLNLLAAISCARACGVEFERINAALSKLTLPERRMEFLDIKGIHFINDCYNAAEISVKAALDVLTLRKCSGRKIAVLGHMAELGKYSEECHKRVGEYAIDRADLIVGFGKDCVPLVDVVKSAKKKVHYFVEFEDLISFLQDEINPGDAVLVKGSRGLQLERVVARFGENT